MSIIRQRDILFLKESLANIKEETNQLKENKTMVTAKPQKITFKIKMKGNDFMSYELSLKMNLRF